jgi:hypothetical protein
MKIVELHGGRPPINDIPERLRWLANQFESNEIKAESILILVPNSGIPDGYNFGECLTFAQRICCLELVKFDLMRDVR